MKNMIGHCTTCTRKDCKHPKIKVKWPEKGCREWTDGEPFEKLKNFDDLTFPIQYNLFK